MKLNSTDVIIERLRVIVPQAERQDAISELRNASWPRPNKDGWVFIRELKVRAPRPWLGQRAVATAKRFADSAIGAGTAGADRAHAVRFGGLAELLAWLSADLVTGHAAKRWYWQRWAQLFELPASEAVRRLWLEHISYLPAITACLAQIGALSRVWPALTPAQALQLYGALGQYTGIALPPPKGTGDLACEDTELARVPGGLTERWVRAVDGLDVRDPRPWLAACLVALEWRPLLLQRDAEALLLRIGRVLVGVHSQARPGDDAVHISQVEAEAPVEGMGPKKLAARPPEARGLSMQPPGQVRRSTANRQEAPGASSVGEETTAGAAQDPGQERRDWASPESAFAERERIQRRNRGLVRPGELTVHPPGGLRPLIPPSEGVPGVGADRHAAPAQASVEEKRASEAVSTQASGPAHGRRISTGTAFLERDRKRVRTRGPASADVAVRRSGRETGAQQVPTGAEADRIRRLAASGRRPGHDAHPTAEQVSPIPAVASELHTAQGGLFYLINFLNRPEVGALLESHGGMSVLPDGWAWLYRLGVELGLEPSGALARFLAQRMGLDEVAALEELPPLPARAELLALGEHLYAKRDVWNESLIAVPAWITHTPSHLDLYMPLSHVRLSVRLAALDVNPGWVPWLGRVVTFFYQDSPLSRP